MSFLVVGLLLVSVAALMLAGAAALRHHLRRPDALEQLGVKTTYPLKCLPKAKIDSYYELKDRMQEQFARDTLGYSRGSQPSDGWMSALPVRAKDELKYRLMQRAIGDMAALQKIDSDARGYWRLFCKGVITTQFWSSVMDAERELSQELESVKTEASNVEPTQDPQGILSEAMKFVVRYGDKLPSAAELASSADALADLLKHLPPMPGMPGGMPPLGLPGMPLGGLPGMPPGGLPGMLPLGGLAGMPPGGLPPGAMPPCGMPPGGLPPGMRTPFGPPPNVAPSGGSCDAYNWKQDADEIEVSVNLPTNATKANVKVVFQTRTIKVEHCGEVLIEGTLAGICRPENSTWTLSKGRVVLSLDKAGPRPWLSLLAEPKV